VVADPEVDPPVRLGPLLVVLALAAVALAPAFFLPTASAATPAATGSSSITGNLTGPGLLATSANTTFYLNASGGPAFVNGNETGTINWTATLSGANTTGTLVTPSGGTVTSTTRQPARMVVLTNGLPQTMTLTVKIVSTPAGAGGKNETTNFTRTFRVITPYIVRATLVAGPQVTVLPFNVTVALDGTTIGSVPVPRLAPNASFQLVYRYPSGGLSSGYHTFTLSVAEPHGLVTFANGATVESTTFYVAPSAVNDTVWYVAGFVAFFGVLFIYATRVAARRQGSARR